MAATLTKLSGFVEHLAEKVHNLGSDTLAVALSNTAPSAQGTRPDVLTANCILANVTQVAYTYLSSRGLSLTASAQTSGVYKLALADVTLTSTGGSTGPFRYVYIYNDTPTSPADPLIGYYDYGTSITLGDGESLTINFDDANGVLTIA